MKKLILVFALIFVGLFATDTARAQASFALGPSLSYDIDSEKLLVGADGLITTPALVVQINPAVHYMLDVEGGSIWRVDLNVRYPFGIENQVFTPYTGLGGTIGIVNPEFGDSDTNLGVNLLGGAVFGFGALQPFAEARLIFQEGDTAALVRGGVLFSF